MLRYRSGFESQRHKFEDKEMKKEKTHLDDQGSDGKIIE